MDTINVLRTSRSLPTRLPDGVIQNDLPDRGSQYNEPFVLSPIPTKHLLTDEGSYCIATNPTPGTGIAYGAAGTQAAFSDTVPFLLFQNQNQPGGKRFFLDFVKLIQIGGTAPATTTSVQAVLRVDPGNRFFTSAGTTYAAVNLVKSNGDDPTSPNTKLWVPNGAVATIPASTGAARQIGRAQLKGGPTLLLDEYNIAFGMCDGPSSGGYATTVASYQTRMPAFCLAPQEYGILHLWFPGGATNPFTFEMELAGWER